MVELDAGPGIEDAAALADDENMWRDWLARCAAPCLDAAERLAARVNAAMTTEEAPHP